jgi:hypothetical protein
MTAPEMVTITSRTQALERPTADNPIATAPVLGAAWCRSVGTFWTLELHRLDGGTTSGTIVDWITSDVPISQPEPHTLTQELLAERGLHLFPDCSANPGIQNRHRIGYVCTNAELIKLAHLIRDDATKAERHPVALAAQWIAAGFSANAAARWIRQGVHSPQTVPRQAASSQIAISPTHTRTSSRPPSRLRNRTCGPRGTAAPRDRHCPCRRRP